MTKRHLRVVRDGDDPVTFVDDADRRWFEDNPFATFRIRPYIAGENPEPGPTPEGYVLWVRVTQVIPGVLYRQMGYARAGEVPEKFHPAVDPATHARIKQRALEQPAQP